MLFQTWNQVWCWIRLLVIVSFQQVSPFCSVINTSPSLTAPDPTGKTVLEKTWTVNLMDSQLKKKIDAYGWKIFSTGEQNGVSGWNHMLLEPLRRSLKLNGRWLLPRWLLKLWLKTCFPSRKWEIPDHHAKSTLPTSPARVEIIPSGLISWPST